MRTIKLCQRKVVKMHKFQTASPERGTEIQGLLLESSIFGVKGRTNSVAGTMLN